jgi:excisionase family DNA binding protein
MNIPAEPVALTVRDFAACLGVSESHVWKLLRDEKLAALRIGRRTLIPRTEVDRLLGTATAVRLAPAKEAE